MIKIINPIWVKDTGAYFSISKWNFQKETIPNKIEVEVYKGNKFMGKGVIDKKTWINTAKLKEKKVVFRPDDPMVYYYNTMLFVKPLTKDEELAQMFKDGVLS